MARLNNEVMRAIDAERLHKAFAWLETEETPYEAKVRRLTKGIWYLTIRCNERQYFSELLNAL